MSITKKEVEHIAQLARLGIAEKEKAKFQRELSAILTYVKQLQEVKIKDVKPTSQVTGLSNVMREDRVEGFWQEKKLIKLAPDHKGGCVKTKAILE